MVTTRKSNVSCRTRLPIFCSESIKEWHKRAVGATVDWFRCQHLAGKYPRQLKTWTWTWFATGACDWHRTLDSPCLSCTFVRQQHERLGHRAGQNTSGKQEGLQADTWAGGQKLTVRLQERSDQMTDGLWLTWQHCGSTRHSWRRTLSVRHSELQTV
jgi:hypothetical protein